MRRVLLLVLVVLCAAGASHPLLAQKTAPQITRDSDRDGVPDPRDTCARTPPNTRVDARGCPEAAPPLPTAPVPTAAAPTPVPLALVPPAANPVAANPPPQSRPDTGHGRAPPPATPPANAPTGQPVTQATPGSAVAPVSLPPPAPAASAASPQPAQPNQAARPMTPAGQTSGVAPPTPGAAPVTSPVTAPVTVPVTPTPVVVANPPARPAQPTQPPADVRPPQPVVDPSETIGLWIPAYTGHTDAEQLEYVRSMVMKLDSAVLALVETFRGTSGMPLAGATDPGKLSRREKDRWLRCRNITNDLKTMSDAAAMLKDSVAGGAALQRAVGALSGAFEAVQGLESCDVVNGMIEFPERANPWGPNYESEAHNFYRDWYAQVRTVHSAARDVARALNPALPAARRIPVPPAIATTPPYSGAAR